MAGMRAVDPRVSYAELGRWPDDGRRYELYEGEPIVVPSPNIRHQIVVSNLNAVLRVYARRTGGLALVAPLDVVLSKYDVLEPDVVYFGPAKRARLVLTEPAYVVPDLAIEVLSRSTEARDRGRKMVVLARYRLPEYWLADPAAQIVEVYVLQAGQLVPHDTYERLNTIESPTLSGLRIGVEAVFADSAAE
jgi:Uma2 family endonuclease